MRLSKVFRRLLRLRNLEEVTSQIDSQLASAELVSQENLIGEIVKRKIEEELKDLKKQHKNSIPLLTKKVKDLEEQFETKLTALKTDMEKIKTRISNTNERCGKMEKSLKEVDNLMIIKVNELRDQLTKDLTTKNNTVFKNISLLDESIQEIKNEVIMAKDTVDKVVQEELVDEINEEQKSVEKLVEGVSELVSTENVEHKDVYKRQEVPFSLRNKEKDHDHSDQETIAYRNKGDNIIVLMDSNRWFMDIEASFVNKKVRTIPCGSVQKAKSIIDNPRFQEIDAILTHTGTNDLEDSSLDSQTIASNLLQVTNNATRKFPSAEVFCQR